LTCDRAPTEELARQQRGFVRLAGPAGGGRSRGEPACDREIGGCVRAEASATRRSAQLPWRKACRHRRNQPPIVLPHQHGSGQAATSGSVLPYRQRAGGNLRLRLSFPCPLFCECRRRCCRKAYVRLGGGRRSDSSPLSSNHLPHARSTVHVSRRPTCSTREQLRSFISLPRRCCWT